MYDTENPANPGTFFLNGLLRSTTLGVVTDAYSYNSFGEMSDYAAQVSSVDQFTTGYVRDKLGRITQKTETVQGVAHTFDYTYNTAGYLVEVKRDGLVTATYTYDLNGNRLNNGAVYDDQDRLTSTSTASYTYTDNGELLTKTEGADITQYKYDVLGNLLSVNLPSGTLIEYVIDGSSRRIGKKVDGTLEKVWLYKDQLNPIAELDGQGNLISRFVYTSKFNIPDYVIKGGVTYRIITDHLGSPRLLVNIASGGVVQQVDYNEWGEIIVDTNPGFQPFGFAGGLYDLDTKLIHLGTRDYDPEVGRWTIKDPILFRSKSVNLFRYTENDPINLYDLNGLWSVSVGVYVGYGFTITFGNNNGKNFFIGEAGVGIGGQATFNPWGDFPRPEDSDSCDFEKEAFGGVSVKGGIKIGPLGFGGEAFGGAHVFEDEDGKLDYQPHNGTSSFANTRRSGYGLGAIIKGGLKGGIAW